MTVREFLNDIQSGDLTEEQLLDSELVVVTQAASGDYKVTCGIKKVTIEQEMVYSNLKHCKVPKEKNGAPYVMLQTTMIP